MRLPWLTDKDYPQICSISHTKYLSLQPNFYKIIKSIYFSHNYIIK